MLGHAEPPTTSGTLINLRPPAARRANERPIRVLVADGSRLVAESLICAFATNERLEPVGYALDGWEAVELATALEPDVIVVGAELDGLDSLSFTRLADRVWPRTSIVLLADEQPLAETDRGQAFTSALFVSTARPVNELMNTIEQASAREAAFERIAADMGLRTRLGA